MGGLERVGRTVNEPKTTTDPEHTEANSSIAATVVPSNRELPSDGPPEPVSHDPVIKPSRDRTDIGRGKLPTGTLAPAWCAFASVSTTLIKELLGIYFETVYPM